jgi:DNA-binding transcriptional MocR family regulator
MLETLEAKMPGGVSWTRPGGGFFIWITLPSGIKSSAVKEAAEKEKILLLDGKSFFARPTQGEHLRLSFSYVPEAEIRRGISKLAAVLHSFSV